MRGVELAAADSLLDGAGKETELEGGVVSEIDWAGRKVELVSIVDSVLDWTVEGAEPAGVGSMERGVLAVTVVSLTWALTRAGRNRAAAKARDNLNFMMGGNQSLLFSRPNCTRAGHEFERAT